MSAEVQPEFNIETTELEFKYDGSDIKLSKFVDFAQSLNPVKRVEGSGWDYYYSGEGQNFEFIRFRYGGIAELTIKIKSIEKNNNNRFELDVPLSLNVSLWMIEKFVSLFGFKENFRVYKYFDIYWFEKVDIVYYTIYNKDMSEIGRRVEIEARKDYPFKSSEEALAEVKAMEQKMSEIGITPQKRMKKSMWEQFRK
jgi:adenylate cyclase class IV